ncbi:hypothetical protein [Arcticibacter sp. MXS-1]|uniref:hypothetical protein n=1 Tax=Arcticibacter sp. MXS-1 TaxID=3341726 RepID=UPI0035A97C62
MVEEALTCREVLARYGMTKGRLSEWMKGHSSQEYQAGKRRIYRPSEKRSVLRAIESGVSTREAEITSYPV